MHANSAEWRNTIFYAFSDKMLNKRLFLAQTAALFLAQKLKLGDSKTSVPVLTQIYTYFTGIQRSMSCVKNPCKQRGHSSLLPIVPLRVSSDYVIMWLRFLCFHPSNITSCMIHTSRRFNRPLICYPILQQTTGTQSRTYIYKKNQMRFCFQFQDSCLNVHFRHVTLSRRNTSQFELHLGCGSKFIDGRDGR